VESSWNLKVSGFHRRKRAPRSVNLVVKGVTSGRLRVERPRWDPSFRATSPGIRWVIRVTFVNIKFEYLEILGGAP
jgi:hypothetical protein